MAELKTYDILILGGGLAGTAAAVLLSQQGKKIGLIEKRSFLGGRVYSFKDPQGQDSIDNGQHALMGCYHYSLDYLKKIGSLDFLTWLNPMQVPILSEKENFSLQCLNLPGPFHLLSGLFRIPDLNFKEKLSLIRAVLKVKGMQAHSIEQLSSLDFLKKLKQSEKLIFGFWEPFILATLNEELSKASAFLLYQVIQKAFLAKKKDSQLILAHKGLSEVFIEKSLEKLKTHQADLFFQKQVTEIKKQEEVWQAIDRSGETYQAKKILLACPPFALSKIKMPLEIKEELHLDQWTSSPILSINLWFETHPDLPKISALSESPIHWIFNKAKILESRDPYLSLLISAADELSSLNKDDLVKTALSEISKHFPQIKNYKVQKSQVIKEKEATFGNKIAEQSLRPTCPSRVPGIYYAGDWTQTELPSTIESAIKSAYLSLEYLS